MVKNSVFYSMYKHEKVKDFKALINIFLILHRLLIQTPTNICLFTCDNLLKLAEAVNDTVVNSTSVNNNLIKICLCINFN